MGDRTCDGFSMKNVAAMKNCGGERGLVQGREPVLNSRGCVSKHVASRAIDGTSLEVCVNESRKYDD